MLQHIFDPTILRSYDIRGIYEKTLNKEDALMLGFFYGITVKKKLPTKENPLIVIGKDGRLSSPILEENLYAGLETYWIDVYIIDIGPTTRTDLTWQFL